jgi:adenine-specific DNA-methyltransferase
MRKQILTWLRGEETFDSKGQRVLEFFFNRKGLLRYRKERGTYHPKTVLPSDVGTTKAGSADLKELFGVTGIVEYPKPTSLVQYFISFATASEDIVLDFFAGSGTTGQAVMAQNALEGTNRTFILVQLPEPTPQGSIANEAGFSTISEVSRKRINLAGEKFKQEAGLLENGLDTGFRAYYLADTNFSKWRMSSDVEEDALQQHLRNLRDSATDDSTADELLTEILLKQGYSLTEAISPAEVGGLDVRLVRDRDGDVAVLAYLNEHVKPTLEQLRAFVDESPTQIIVLEDAFQGDDELKTNLAQLARAKGIELWTA